jgi:hypothetical protein
MSKGEAELWRAQALADGRLIRMADRLPEIRPNFELARRPGLGPLASRCRACMASPGTA